MAISLVALLDGAHSAVLGRRVWPRRCLACIPWRYTTMGLRGPLCRYVRGSGRRSPNQAAGGGIMANRLQKSGVAAALAVSVIGGAEGLRQTAYPDPATRGNPWTICYGHTGHVSPGERESIAQCKALLLADLNKEADGIDQCIHVTMPDTRYVAVLSLAHNIGVGGVCRSSVVRLLNEGRTAEACDFFLHYNRAAGFVMPGLTRRREEEKSLCLEEL